MGSKQPGLTGPTRPTPMYWLLRAFLAVVIWIILGPKLIIEGRDNVPKRGGLLVISNHIATADPPLEGGKFPRPLHFMAKVEWFLGNRMVAFLARQFLCFPVVRHTADRAALRYTLNLLASGQAVCIYPEGTRSMDAQIHRPEPGVGFLARHADVPIVPVGVFGTETVMPKGSHLPKRATVHLVYGKPFRLPSGDMSNEAAADHMMTKVAELLPEQYRGIYATSARLEVGARR